VDVAGGSCRPVVLAFRDCDESFDKILRVYASAKIEMNVAVFLIFTSQKFYKALEINVFIKWQAKKNVKNEK